MRRRLLVLLLLSPIVLVLLPSCARVSLEGGDKPIHIVHDINIRVDRELEQFFAFQQQQQHTPATQPVAAETSTTPTTQPAPVQ